MTRLDRETSGGSDRSRTFARRAACALVALGSTATLVHCALGSPRDVAEPSRDERIQDAAVATPQGGYVYVARRPHGAIGLVGKKHMTDGDAAGFVDRLADELEACAIRQQAHGHLATGAVSFVIASAPNGAAQVGQIEVSPGGDVAANALECLIAPARASTFAHVSKDGVTALAIEATWNPLDPGPAPIEAGVSVTDAGAAGP